MVEAGEFYRLVYKDSPAPYVKFRAVKIECHSHTEGGNVWDLIVEDCAFTSMFIKGRHTFIYERNLAPLAPKEVFAW